MLSRVPFGAAPSTSVLTVIPILEAARELDVDVEAILAAEGLPTAVLTDRTLRIGTADASRLVHAIEDELPGAALSLTAVRRRSLPGLGLLGHLLAAGTTPREVLALLARFAPLMHEGVTFELHEEGPLVALRPVAIGVPIVVPTQIELAFATTVQCAWWIAGAEYPPAEVGFMHPCRADVREYERYFRCPVTFGARRYEIRFPRVYLELPLGGDPEVRETLARLAERTLSERARARSTGVLDRVESTTAEAIIEGDDSLGWVARRLDTTVRTLQRRLGRLGTSFDGVLDGVRKTMALNLLLDARLPIERVSEKVGFKNPTAFARAFRRWTGASPAAYRRASGDEARSVRPSRGCSHL